jgi:hypothetical protein
MVLSEKQLTDIESFSALFFSKKEVFIIMGISLDDYEAMILPDTPFFIAYTKGKLKSEAEVRQSILTLAKMGSAPAQTMAIKIIEDSNKNQIDV